MIARSAPGLSPAEAARRAAAGAEPIWISSPGPAPRNEADIGLDVVACDPVALVEPAAPSGGAPHLAGLEEAWAETRGKWGATGAAPPAAVPVGVGWFSYDLGRRWLGLPERAPGAAAAGSMWPDLHVRFFDALWIRRTEDADGCIVACDEAAASRLARRLAEPAAPLPPPSLGLLSGTRAAADERSAHAAAVARIKDYLVAGDAYQVNLARGLTAPVGAGDPLWMAAALRERSPAPHALWMGSRSSTPGPIDRLLVGNSPERFLHVGVDGRVETRPIKGTRPRGATAAEDAAARLALAASPKDRAEHVMIVDLERNDLGRVCETGSVTVNGLLRVLELPTVFHLVSTVEGRLRSGVGFEELLRATFPGGSITGAPKRRAMEIIEELEPVRRQIYTGATGWLGAAGDLDLAVAIRTATVAAGRLSLFVGGGIVADSDAAAEWEETNVKARAFASLW